MRAAKFCGLGFAALIVLAIFAGGLVVWRLQSSENSAFLREQFLDGLAVGLGPGNQLTLEKAGLQVNGLAPTFAVGGLKIENKESGAKVFLDRADFVLRPAAFWRLSAQPTAIRFDGLKVVLNHQDRGPIAQAPEALVAAIRTTLVSMNLGLSGEGEPFSALSEIDGKGIDLYANDPQKGEVLVRSGLTLRLAREDAGAISLRFGATDTSESITMRGQADAARNDQRLVRLTTEGLKAGSVFAVLGEKNEVVAPGLGIDFISETIVDGAGNFLSGRAALALREGRVAFPDPDIPPIDLKTARLDLRMVPGRGAIEIETLEVAFGEARIVAGGSLTPLPAAEGGFRLSLTTKTAALDRLSPQEPVLMLDHLQAEGRFSPSLMTFTLDQLDLKAGAGSAQIAGKFSLEQGGLIETNVEARGFDLRTAFRIWPVSVAPPIRQWMVKHAHAGVLTQLSVRSSLAGEALIAAFQKKPLPDDALSATFQVDQFVGQPLLDVPPVTHGSLSGQMTGRKAGIILSDARLEAAPGKVILVPQARFLVADGARVPVVLDALIPFSGRSDALLALLAAPSIKPYANVPADLKIVSGHVDGEATLVMRLVEKPKPTDTKVDLKANLRDFVVDDIVPGEKLEAGQFRLVSERGMLRLSGTAQLFGVPAQIDVKGDPGKPQVSEVKLSLDDAQRAKRGFDMRPILTGPVQTTFIVTALEGKKSDIDVVLDLTKAKVEGGVPGFLKKPGQPAKISFDFAQKSDGIVLDELNLDLGSITAQGRVELGKDSQLSKAEFTSLKMSPGDNITARFERMKTGMKVSIRGNSFDLRPFLRGFQSGQIDESKNNDLDLDLQTTVLLGFHNELISAADIQAQKRAGRLARLSVKGRFGADALVVSTTDAKLDSMTLKIDTTDGGALVRFMDFYSRMQGGRLTSEILVSATSQIGLVQVRDFVLRDEPAVRQYAASTGSTADGPMGTARRTRGSDVPFTKMRLDFTRRPGRLDLREAVMWGPTIGGTLEGYLDYAQDRVDLKGSFVPAYALNNVFAQVPVFGQLLGGSQYEGLFAVPFLINGKASAPVLRTNPISAIAPGFLRKFFEIQREQSVPQR